MIAKHFPVKPKEIVEKFQLKRPIYHRTSCYGHFGKQDLPWEALDKVAVLKKETENEIQLPDRMGGEVPLG